MLYSFLHKATASAACVPCMSCLSDVGLLHYYSRVATSAMWKNGTGDEAPKALQPRRRRRRAGEEMGRGYPPAHPTRGP